MPDGQAISTASTAVARAQPEVQPEVALRVVARSAHHLVHLRASPRGHLHARADGGPVRLRAHALDEDRGVPVAAVVAQQRGGPSRLLTTTSTSPSLSKSPNAQPRPRCSLRDGRPGARRDVLEAAVPQVPVQQPRLPVRQVQLSPGNLRVHVPVGDEDVLPAVVVVVEESTPNPRYLRLTPSPALTLASVNAPPP